VSCTNSIVASMVKRLPSNEPLPETESEVPFGSVVGVGGIPKFPIPDTVKTNGIPSATSPSIVVPFAITGIVSVKLSIASPSVLKYVAVPI